MNKINSMKRALEQAFWANYPTLNEQRDYGFEDLFSQLDPTVYSEIFWQLVQSNELPLIPVIPLQNNGVVNRVALDYQ